MPKLEPKQIQKELEQGMVWPVYWLYGPEKMKSRELLKRIRKTVLADHQSAFDPETVVDANLIDAATLLDAAQSPSLGGGIRLIIVRDAHALKEADQLGSLLAPAAKVEKQPYVIVFLSKDLDGRKKFSKILTEKAAVVACDAVPESEREAWIKYLAKQKKVEIDEQSVLALSTLDPWTLDMMDQELEKLSLSSNAEVLQEASGSFHAQGGADAFLDAFFNRRLTPSLERVKSFAHEPDEALPLLGLFAWNVRQMSLLQSDRAKGTRYAKLSPYLAERFQRWASQWQPEELLRLQSRLADIDYGFKQTPLLPLGLWSTLVTEFCS